MKKNIELDEAVALLNAGGWVYDQWAVPRYVGVNTEQRAFMVVEAVVSDDTLVVISRNGSAYRKQVDKLSFAVCGEDTPDTLEVTVTTKVKQQRSPYDGGGFTEKEQINRHRYVNLAALERIRERERKEQEAQWEREANELKAAREAFASEQQKRIGDAKVEGLSFDSDGLTIQFGNGYTLRVELAGDGEMELHHLEIDWNGVAAP